MSTKSKSVWDSCSTAHVSLSGKMLAALNTVGHDKGISQSKVVQMLLLESKTLNVALDDLADKGLFDPMESRYEEFKKKEEACKSTKQKTTATTEQECIVCGTKYINTKRANTIYCSRKCGKKANPSTLSYSHTTDRGAAISEGIALSKKIKQCNTGCLIEEFGDIE